MLKLKCCVVMLLVFVLEILSMAEVLQHLVKSFSPLKEATEAERRHIEGTLAVLPSKVAPCCKTNLLALKEWYMQTHIYNNMCILLCSGLVSSFCLFACLFVVVSFEYQQCLHL